MNIVDPRYFQTLIPRAPQQALVNTLRQPQQVAQAEPDVMTDVPAGYDADYSAVEYQKALAKALREKAGKSLETNRMAGGYVIPISPFEGLAKLGVGYMAGRAEKKATAKEAEMKAKSANALSTALRGDTIDTANFYGDADTRGKLDMMNYMRKQALADASAQRQAAIDLENAKERNRPKNITSVPRGDKVDIYFDGVYSETKPVSAKPDTVLRIGDGRGVGTKPPKDMRVAGVDENGNPKFENIPGSAKDVKEKATAVKNKEKLATINSSIDAELRTIDQLIGSEDGKIKAASGVSSMTGTIESRLPTLRQNTADAEALHEKLKAQTSLAGLRDLRATAGSPGAITEREWPLLQQQKTAIGLAQSKEQYVKELAHYREMLRATQAAANAAGEESSGGDGGGLTPDEQQELELLRQKFNK